MNDDQLATCLRPYCRRRPFRPFEIEFVSGKTVKVTDEVDISLVKPRPRRYETAGAASATDGAPKSAKTSVRPEAP